MKISLRTSKKKRKNYRYDPKRQTYITYKIDGRIGGKRKRPNFPTKKAAEDFIADAQLAQTYKRNGIKRAVGGPHLSTLLEKRLTKITNDKEQVRGKRVFSCWLSLLSDPRVTDVSSGDIQLYINARLEKVKKETVNREVNLISKALNSASELFPKELEGYEPPKIPRPKFKRKRREKIITEKEKDAILANLYAEQGKETEAEYQNRIRIGRMFELAWYLGMAYKEVAWLTKTAYNGTGLEFIREKSDNPVKFEWLPERVHEILRSAIADSETEFVFTRSGSTPKDFYKIVRTAIEAADLPYGRDHGITFHSARHSFVTTAMQYADLKTVGSMSGHSDDTMVLIYTHATPESRKKALQAMYSKTNWRDIFDRVRKGKMSFAEFEKVVS